MVNIKNNVNKNERIIMEKKSIKINFIMNSILTCSSFIFPLITFPYISRVLLVTGNGKINFATSVISYIMTISMLGIPLYGIKVCATDVKNKERLSKTVQELLIINLIMGLISLFVLLVCVLYIPKLRIEWKLFSILSTTIFLNIIGIEWFYKAIEEYSYIAVRTIIFKIIGIILMFIFIHKETDYLYYAVITVIAGSGSFIFNFIRAKRYIIFKKFKNYNFKKHIKPIFSFFFLSVSWTIYQNLDIVMLGFIRGDEQVGYYSAAVKIKAIAVSVVSALGAVLLPRIVSYFDEKRYSEARRILVKNSSFILLLSLYISGYFVINSRETILLLSGEAYINAIPVMKVIMFSIIFIGFSTMVGTNILVPIGKEKITIQATLLGIVVNLMLNIIFIRKYAAIGAALATVIGEFSIVFYEFIYLKKDIWKYFDLKNCLKIIVSFVCSISVLAFLKINFSNISIFTYLFLSGLIYSIVYAIVLLVLKERIVFEVLNTIVMKLKE